MGSFRREKEDEEEGKFTNTMPKTISHHRYQNLYKEKKSLTALLYIHICSSNMKKAVD